MVGKGLHFVAAAGTAAAGVKSAAAAGNGVAGDAGAAAGVEPKYDVSSAPSLCRPAGGGVALLQRGRVSRRAVLPPSQRLVLVTGSVREVRMWEALSGVALVALEDHSGPVTSISLVHGALVTLAMGDGLIVYKCNGLDTPPTAPAASSTSSTSSAPGMPEQVVHGGGAGAGGPRPSGAGPGAAAARLRQAVAAHRRPLEPVTCLQDGVHHSFAAALATHLEGLAVGSGTGDITYLDFRPRASPLPSLIAGRQQQQAAALRAAAAAAAGAAAPGQEGGGGGGSAFVLRF